MSNAGCGQDESIQTERDWTVLSLDTSFYFTIYEAEVGLARKVLIGLTACQRTRDKNRRNVRICYGCRRDVSKHNA
jgi:hypothetical protein